MKMFTHMQNHPDDILAVYDDERRLYNRDVLNQAHFFEEKIGHRLIFILCRNVPSSLLGYLGCLRAGTVPLLLDAEISFPLLRHLLRTYHPPFLWMPEDVYDRCEAEMKQDQLSEQTSVGDWKQIEDSDVGISADGRQSAAGDYVLVRTGFPGPKLHPDLRLLLTTSGSTGSPKLVRLSAKNLDDNAASIVQYLHLNAQERPITMLPMQYSYGMSIINSHVMVGALIVLTSYTLMDASFWKRVQEKKVTSFAGVPYTYQMLDRLKVTEMKLPSLQYLTQAGGKLSLDLHRKFAQWCSETGRRFFVMYGQTEAAPRMGYLPSEKALKKCGSMGIAIPGGRLEIIDVDGKYITEADVVGELVYFGANVSLGYAEQEEDLNLGDENHGVLATGDMAKKDAEGFFYIVGRKRRFVKALGKRVNLDEVERLAAARFKVNTACVGCDDAVFIYVEKDDSRLKAIRRYLSDTLLLPEKLFVVRSISAIPKNASGKTLYRELSAEVPDENP